MFDSDRGRMLLYSVVQLQQPAPNYYEGSLWEWARRRTLLTGINQGTSPQPDAFEWCYFVDDPTCALGPQ